MINYSITSLTSALVKTVWHGVHFGYNVRMELNKTAKEIFLKIYIVEMDKKFFS